MREEHLCRGASGPRVEAWQPSRVPMAGGQWPGRQKRVPGGETVKRRSAVWVLGFYKVPVASDAGLEGGLKATDLAWTCSAPHQRAAPPTVLVVPGSLFSLSRAGGPSLLQSLPHLQKLEEVLLPFRKLLPPTSKAVQMSGHVPLQRSMGCSEIKDSIFMCENPLY